MLNRLIGSGSTISDLRADLSRSTENVRQIAHRVANAGSRQNGNFASALEDARGGDAFDVETIPGEPIDLEREMVALAEEQLRYQTSSALIQKIYQQIRTSIKDG